MIQFQHENGNKGCLIVDVVSPCAERLFEAYTENAWISWKGTPDSLIEFNTESKMCESVLLNEEAEHINGYSAFVVENAYRNEIEEEKAGNAY